MTKLLSIDATLKSSRQVKEDFAELMRQLSAPIPNNLVKVLTYTTWQDDSHFHIQFMDDAILRAFISKPNDAWKVHCADLIRGITQWLMERAETVSLSFFSHHQDPKRLVSEYKTLDELLSLSKAPFDMKIILPRSPRLSLNNGSHGRTEPFV